MRQWLWHIVQHETRDHSSNLVVDKFHIKRDCWRWTILKTKPQNQITWWSNYLARWNRRQRWRVGHSQVSISWPHQPHFLNVLIILHLHLDLYPILDLFNSCSLHGELGVDKVVSFDFEFDNFSSVPSNFCNSHLLCGAARLLLLFVLQDVVLPSMNSWFGKR